MSKSRPGEERAALRRVFWINAALDVAYVVTGASLLAFGRTDAVRGTGASRRARGAAARLAVYGGRCKLGRVVIASGENDFWARTLRALAPLSEDDLAEISGHLVPVDLQRGSAFLRVGETPSRVGVVVSGLLREAFLRDDGTERTRNFAIEGGLVGSLSDLARGGPARTMVVAEEPSRVLTVEWSVVQAAVARNATWQTLMHRLTEALYVLKAEREWELLGLDAEERYRAFRARYPGLEARVAQRHVASYLGITPEHLSRIRARTRRSG